MAIGSGLAAQVGYAPEVTFGTYVAATRFADATAVDLKKVKNTAQGGGYAAGRLVQSSARRVVTTQAAAGTLAMEVTTSKMGLLLQHIMGGTVTPVQQAATTAYLQTHPLADNVGKSLSVQVGVPDTTGTVRPYTYLGTKVTGAEFSCGVDEFLTVALDLDCRDVSEASGLATASYTAGLTSFHFGQMTVKAHSTYGSEAAVAGVKKVSLKVERPQNVARFYAGASGLKAEPIVNDVVKISGTIEADFLDKATWADRFAADTKTALVFEWVGPLIASTYYQTFRIKVPAAFFDGDTPTPSGNDVVSGSFTFTGLYDETNAAAIIEYISTDTTV